jgi:DNA-binding MarR family transcriptional regulator
MVKPLDDGPFPELLDHVGVRLWRAAYAWKRAFDAGMVALGHGEFAQARSGLLGYMDRMGTRQADLAERSRLTKQAVQQFVDELVSDGLVERSVDPRDKRARIVTFTARGRKVLADANQVKRRVEAEFRGKLGQTRFRQLLAALRSLDDGT